MEITREQKKYMLIGAGLLLVLIIVILIFAAGINFLIEKFSGESGPGQMLIIGNSSQEVIGVLEANPQMVNYIIKSPSSMKQNPKDMLKQYALVMLDQSEEANKEVSFALGNAITEYVNEGGKLIVVMDSGTRREGAYDIIGWQNTFSGIVPALCEIQGLSNKPSCTEPIIVRGKIAPQDRGHPIMEGIEVVPPEPDLYIVVTTFNITPAGNEIARIEDFSTRKTYAAIIEKNSLAGKTIYFNYNPGKTRGIFEATLQYLLGK